MTARAIWKGVLKIGEGVPVKLYSAVEDRTIHFRLLHEEDRVPVERRMVDPRSGEEVPPSERLRGYETEDGRIVILDDEDLEALEPEPSREMEILRFVDPAEISPVRYDRPYYLGPDGDRAAWKALAQALRDAGKEGIVRWVMRKKRYVGALSLHRGCPVLVTLRREGEVLEASDVEAPGGRELTESEREMAEELVETMEGSFEPDEWEDQHRARLRELIEAKAEGKTLSLEEYREQREETEDLEEALKASLQEASEKKGA